MSIEKPPPADICFTGEIVAEYTKQANEFTQDLSSALLGPITTIFVSLVGLWCIIEFARLIRNKKTVYDVIDELLFVMLAAALLAGQGPELINAAYSVALSTMGSIASVAMQVGNQGDQIAAGSEHLNGGMVALVCAAEKGVSGVFRMSSFMAQVGTLTDPMPYLYALALVIPYGLVLVVYFSQVVVAIFRIIMLATLSPFLMLAFAFGWGRGMAQTGIKTFIAAFMVLFGATAAMSIMLYGLNSLDIGAEPTKESVRAMADLENHKFLLTLAMGLLGTAFMTEATGMANSIANSSLTNTAVAVITGGAATMAAAAAQNPAAKGMLEGAATRAGNFMHNSKFEAMRGAEELIKKMKK